MKKTIKVNLSGLVFNLDEDAFEALNQYLESIKNHFGDNSEGNEIVSDIEYRIAELMQLKINTQKQVISIEDINEIIGIMGKPEDIFHTDEDTDEDTTQEKTEKSATNRKFYRDIDNNWAGGVCAGLGAHFNIDPIIIRILFIVLAIPLFSFPAILYFILWIAIPAAITPQQKMQMKGSNYTLSDIESSVKNEYEKVKSGFQRMKHSDQYEHTRQKMNTAGSGLVEIIAFFGKVIVMIIGVALIIAGISMFASMFGVFMFSDSFLFWTHTDQHHTLIPDFLYGMVNPNSLILVTISIFILIMAPIIAIIYWGLKLILRFKANDKIISVVASVSWILSIIILVGITLFEAKEYAFSTSVDDKVEMNLTKEQTLHINSNTDMSEFSEVYFFEEGLEVYSNDEQSDRIFMKPEFTIRYTKDDHISIRIEKEARGATTKQARINAKNIAFDWHLEDSTLHIDPLFYCTNKSRWTFPELEIILYLPEDQKVCIDKDLKKTLNHVNTSGDIRTNELPGKCWVMTPDGLDHP